MNFMRRDLRADRPRSAQRCAFGNPLHMDRRIWCGGFAVTVTAVDAGELHHGLPRWAKWTTPWRCTTTKS